MDTSEDKILVERQGSHLWLTLNRPDKANAMTVAMVEQVTAQIHAAARDDGVTAVLLAATGTRVFCGGVDVREKPLDGDEAKQRERRSFGLAALQDAVLISPKPILVVLNGTASGAGGMLALMADACVAVESAELSLPEIDIGIASFSGASILEVIGGRALALDLIQSGRRMPAREALSRGLVRAVVPREELQAVATATAELLGAKSTKAFSENKRWINRGLTAALAEARDEHARHRAKAASKTSPSSVPVNPEPFHG